MSNKEMDKHLSYLQRHRARPPINQAEVLRLFQKLQKEHIHGRYLQGMRPEDYLGQSTQR